METNESSEPDREDYTPAVPLEISQEMAEQVDELLREFAEDASLETVLVVERSGALVTGISAEADVTVDVISALVAGASGAVRALASELGETGELESLHQGQSRTVYLREVSSGFVLVGVSESDVPVGLMREKARQVRGPLSELLESVEVAPLEEVDTEPRPASRSLREVAMERAAARAQENSGEGNEETSPLIEDTSDEEGFDLEKLTKISDEDQSEASDESEETDDSIESIFEIEEGDEESVEIEAAEGDGGDGEEKSEAEPTEVLEPLEVGEDEIVIEKEDGTIASPFEMEEEEDEEEPLVPPQIVLEPGEPVESIFELEIDEEENEAVEEEEVSDDDEGKVSADHNDVLEILIEDDETETENLSTTSEDPETAEMIFEIDDEAEEDDLDVESEKAEAVEEEEVRGSGPFYF